jgi:uncharacterized protein YodC (DUF2158 family)
MSSFQNPSKQKYIIEGMNLRLTCSANTLNSSNIMYTWFHVIGVTKVIRSHGVDGPKLLIANIKRDQNGMYECQASDNQNNISGITNVIITVMRKYQVNKSPVYTNNHCQVQNKGT